MVTDGQVRKLWRLLSRGEKLAAAARKTGMDETTARKYRDSGQLPSESKPPRTWRTRPDPFAEVWPEVETRLEAEPRLRAFTLFAWLQDQYPGRFSDSQRRTFERRVSEWRAKSGPNQEVFFPQVHHPGGLGASDFTNMNALRITIAGQPFEHLLYHFTLTYSNWEFVSICFSESFEALSRGLQDAFWELGGVPGRHRSDSLSAAVNNLSQDREFRQRYQDLMDHYQVQPHRINVRKANENGDVESSHGHLKTVVEQALLLRGSRDFSSRQEYGHFLQALVDKRNASRAVKFAQEQACLGDLPPCRIAHQHRVTGIRVSKHSTIQIKHNTYSVPSRLIGYRVDAEIDADFIVVSFRGTEVQRMPRLAGSGKHAVNYRHVIDSLVRKPGAFENYRYREDMFPTAYFRMAYDWLCDQHGSHRGTREYLKILQLAARDSEDAVQDALRLAITNNLAINSKSILLAVEHHQQLPSATEVDVEPPDLNDYDCFFHPTDKEVDSHESVPKNGKPPQEATSEAPSHPETQHAIDRTVPGPASAHVPGTLREPRGTSEPGCSQSHRVSLGVGGVGVSSSTGEPDLASSATVPSAFHQDLAQLRLDASPVAGDSPVGKSARRFVPGPSGERAGVRQAGVWQEPLSGRVGRTTGSPRPFDLVYHLQSPGPRPADCQTGLTLAQGAQAAVAIRRPDHRRPGLRPAKSRGDGGAIYAPRRALRTRQRDADEQLAVQQMGTDLQGRHDHGGRDRPASPSQRDLGAERPKLPARGCQAERCQPTQNFIQEAQNMNHEKHIGILVVAKADE